MTHSVGFIVLAILLFAAQIGYAQRTCTDAEARRALHQADWQRTWAALYRSYRLYGHCDDGAVAEGYSESVARILVDHWDTLPELARLSKRDAQFRRFVIGHLDATLNMDDVEAVKRKAKTRCPARFNGLCRDLAKQADSAVEESSAQR